MQIVTDSGTDVNFTPEEMERYGVHVVPLTVTLGGQSYREGIYFAPDAFYRMLDEADTLPVTSQPAVGACQSALLTKAAVGVAWLFIAT